MQLPRCHAFERYFGYSPDLSQLHVFGERAVAKIPASKRSTRFKFSERGQTGAIVGNARDTSFTFAVPDLASSGHATPFSKHAPRACVYKMPDYYLVVVL